MDRGLPTDTILRPDQARCQTGALGAIAPSVGLITSSVLIHPQRVQSEAPEGAMRPKEDTIAPSAPVWLRAWTRPFPMKDMLEDRSAFHQALPCFYANVLTMYD